MDEDFMVLDDMVEGDLLYAHSMVNGARRALGHSTCAGRTSSDLVGTATIWISFGTVIRERGDELVNPLSGRVVGTRASRTLPRDHLLTSALERETERAAAKVYRPDRHTDFDVEHGWRVTMEMGRGG